MLFLRKFLSSCSIEAYGEQDPVSLVLPVGRRKPVSLLQPIRLSRRRPRCALGTHSIQHLDSDPPALPSACTQALESRMFAALLHLLQHSPRNLLTSESSLKFTAIHTCPLRTENAPVPEVVANRL